MRGKAYLSMGGTSMGIAGSMVDYAFWEKWLGMRVEDIDMSEFVGRMNKNQFDPAGISRQALAWVEAELPRRKRLQRRRPKTHARTTGPRVVGQCEDGADRARPDGRQSQAWPKWAWHEQAHGHQAIAAGFQGQRQWTDHFPNGDFLEAILNTSFDWNGKRTPYIVATENDALNAATMLFGHLLTNTAQIFADLRTYWSPDAVAKACDGYQLEGAAKDGLLHLINSGPAALDGTGQQETDGQPTMKPFWEITDEEVERCLQATTWHPSITEYFPGGGMSTRFRTRGGMPATMTRINLVAGLGPHCRLPKVTRSNLPERSSRRLGPTHQSDLADHVVRSAAHRRGAFTSTYEVMNHWGANHCVMTAGHVGHLFITLASMLRIPVYMHNVSRGSRLSTQCVERVWHRGSRGGRLPRLCELRPAVRLKLTTSSNTDNS